MSICYSRMAIVQQKLPALVYEIRSVGGFGNSAYGIELSNAAFTPDLPKVFASALDFMRAVCHTQQYFVLRINSPGGIISTVLCPILDMLYDKHMPTVLHSSKWLGRIVWWSTVFGRVCVAPRSRWPHHAAR